MSKVQLVRVFKESLPQQDSERIREEDLLMFMEFLEVKELESICKIQGHAMFNVLRQESKGFVTVTHRCSRSECEYEVQSRYAPSGGFVYKHFLVGRKFQENPKGDSEDKTVE